MTTPADIERGEGAILATKPPAARGTRGARTARGTRNAHQTEDVA